MASTLTLALLVFTIVYAGFVKCLGNIKRLRSDDGPKPFSPSVDVFTNINAGNKTFCDRRNGACVSPSCTECRCGDSSAIFMSYGLGCINKAEVPERLKSDRCMLHTSTFQYIPAIRQSISNTEQYRLYVPPALEENVGTVNVKCISAEVYSIYGDNRTILYNNPTGNRIIIHSNAAYKQIQFKFSIEEKKNMSGMLIYVQLNCKFQEKLYDSCFLFKMEGTYEIPGPNRYVSTTSSPSSTTVQKGNLDDGPNMEVIKAVVIVSCIVLVFLSVFGYFCYKRYKYKQRIGENQFCSEAPRTETVASIGDIGYSCPKDIQMGQYQDISLKTQGPTSNIDDTTNTINNHIDSTDNNVTRTIPNGTVTPANNIEINHDLTYPNTNIKSPYIFAEGDDYTELTDGNSTNAKTVSSVNVEVPNAASDYTDLTDNLINVTNKLPKTTPSIDNAGKGFKELNNDSPTANQKLMPANKVVHEYEDIDDNIKQQIKLNNDIDNHSYFELEKESLNSQLTNKAKPVSGISADYQNYDNSNNETCGYVENNNHSGTYQDRIENDHTKLTKTNNNSADEEDCDTDKDILKEVENLYYTSQGITKDNKTGVDKTSLNGIEKQAENLYYDTTEGSKQTKNVNAEGSIGNNLNNANNLTDSTGDNNIYESADQQGTRDELQASNNSKQSLYEQVK